MMWNYFTFRSITYAQLGQRVLEQGGISCRMMRAPRWMEQRGCSYALRTEGELGDRAESLLGQAQVSWLRRYLWDGKGEARLV